MTPPLSDGEATILGKLAQIAERQAVTTERLISLLERVDGHLVRMDSERDDAVAAVKNHVTTTLAHHDSWWRKFAIVIGAATAVAAALGGWVGKVVSFGGPHPPGR